MLLQQCVYDSITVIENHHTSVVRIVRIAIRTAFGVLNEMSHDGRTFAPGYGSIYGIRNQESQDTKFNTHAIRNSEFKEMR